MKPLVIYHASCADGFAAAFAAWTGLGDEAEYVPMQYGKEDESFWRLEDGQFDSEFQILNREIYILDFSFSKWVMEGLFSNAKRVVWLDHHKTAFEMWCEDGERSLCEQSNGRDEVILDNNKSGAMLAWEYFHPGTEVPILIRHIDDYDRWQFKLEGTKEFNKALWSRAPWSFSGWKNLLGNNPAHHLSMVLAMRTEGAAILRAHDQNVQSVVKGSARECWIKAPEPIDLPGSFLDEVTQGWQGLAANCPPHLQSDVGHELANQSGTFGLLWSIDKDGQCKCSLRSNGDYDVSAIAKAFGGGGHRNAAGFTTSIQTLLEWIK